MSKFEMYYIIFINKFYLKILYLRIFGWFFQNLRSWYSVVAIGIFRFGSIFGLINATAPIGRSLSSTLRSLALLRLGAKIILIQSRFSLPTCAKNQRTQKSPKFSYFWVEKNNSDSKSENNNLRDRDLTPGTSWTVQKCPKQLQNRLNRRIHKKIKFRYYS